MSLQFPSNSPKLIAGVSVKTADYNIALTDFRFLLVLNSSAAHTFFMPGNVPTVAGWCLFVQNIGTGLLTVNGNGHNIDAQANITIPTNSGVLITTDGNGTWYTERGLVAGSGALNFSEDTGAANAYVATINLGSPAVIAEGLAILLEIANSNSGASTLSVNGGTANSIVKLNGSAALASGDLVAGQIAMLVWDTTNWQLLSTTAICEQTTNKDAANGYAGLDANGKLKVGEQSETINLQSGTTYTIADSDRGKCVVFDNGGSVAVTLPQAGSGGNFIAGWWCDILSINQSATTLTPTTSVINETLTTLLINGQQSLRIISDGTNYKVLAILTPLAPGANQVLAYNGTTNQWEPTTITSIGNANASEIQGIPVTGNAPGDKTALVARVFPITSVQINGSNVAIIQAVNSLAAGDQVRIIGLTGASFLNNKVFTVLSSGLSGTQFEFNFTHASYGPTADSGSAETIYWLNPIPAGQQATVTTASLAAGAQESDTLTMAKMFSLYSLTVSSAARVRLYSTAAARTADISPDRPNTIPPTPGTQHGVIADFYLDTSDKFTWMCSPIAEGFNNDSPQTSSIYARITNLGASSVAITVTLNFVPQES